LNPSRHPGEAGSATIGGALREAAGLLSAVPQSEPRLEAELLLMQATGLSREHLIAWPERELNADARSRFRRLIGRRLRGEPTAYIRGRQAFWTLDLRVTPETLIPRPETELVVEIALKLLPADAPSRVADVGTGSGAIAAALASERPAWTLFAVDRSPGAVRVAADNLRRYSLGNALVLQGEWLDSFASACLDAVVGNPPYIPEGDPHLDQGDLPFEPADALVSGTDGLAAMRVIVRAAGRCLRPAGLLVLEHGFAQGPAVRELLGQAGFRGIETRRDLAGLDRATCGHLNQAAGDR
jgi:release factor glutamine methyltransferase